MNESKKMLTDVFTSLSKGNVELAEVNFSDEFHSTVLNNELNKKQFINEFTSLRAGIPDLQINLHDVEESGNKVHAFMNLKGTHSAQIPSKIPGFKPGTPSGKTIKAEDVEIEISLKDHKILEIKNVKTGKGVFNELYAQLTS